MEKVKLKICYGKQLARRPELVRRPELAQTNHVTLITDLLVHSRQNPKMFSEYEFDSLKI